MRPPRLWPDPQTRLSLHLLPVLRGVVDAWSHPRRAEHRPKQRLCDDVTIPRLAAEGNEGVRPGAQIEILIDLQMHCLEGGRLFMTQSGAIQTPDLIRNRHFIYAFDRQSGHPIWASRPYPEVRLPLERALTAYQNDPNSRLPIFPEEPHTLLADGSAGSFATCLKNFGIDTFPEWLDAVQRSEEPIILDEQAWLEIKIPDDHAGKGPETVPYGKSVSVWPSAPFMRMEKRFRDKREDYESNVLFSPS